MPNEVKGYIEACHVCNRHEKPRVKPKAGLGCYHAGARMEHVHMDVLGSFPFSEWGN